MLSNELRNRVILENSFGANPKKELNCLLS